MDQQNREDVPSFDLPDWGTDGAPPAPEEPPESISPPPTVTVEVDHSLLTFTGRVPPGWTVEAVLGLIAGEGTSDTSQPAKATTSARKTAIQNLENAARKLGANAVGSVKLAVTARKSHTAVIAYGTAMRLRRE